MMCASEKGHLVSKLVTIRAIISCRVNKSTLYTDKKHEIIFPTNYSFIIFQTKTKNWR
jgi:hypothetical protein